MSSDLPRPPPAASVEVIPEVEAAPSLVQTEVQEGELDLPPPMSNVGGNVDNLMVEVDTSVVGDQDMDRGGNPSPTHEERSAASPASSAHVVPNPHGQPATSSPSAADDGGLKSSARASATLGAELEERRQAMEATLTSSALLPDQRASLRAALGQFRSIEAGMMDTLISLAKGMKVRLFLTYVFLFYSEHVNMPSSPQGIRRFITSEDSAESGKFKTTLSSKHICTCVQKPKP